MRGFYPSPFCFGCQGGMPPRTRLLALLAAHSDFCWKPARWRVSSVSSTNLGKAHASEARHGHRLAAPSPLSQARRTGQQSAAPSLGLQVTFRFLRRDAGHVPPRRRRRRYGGSLVRGAGGGASRARWLWNRGQDASSRLDHGCARGPPSALPSQDLPHHLPLTPPRTAGSRGSPGLCSVVL